MRGELDDAVDRYREGLRLSRELVARRVANACLGALSAIAAERRDVELAGRLWGASEAAEDELGSPLVAAVRGRYERSVARVSGDPAFEAGVEEGRLLTIEQAVDLALASVD